MRTSEVQAWLARKLQPDATEGAPQADYVTISPQEGSSGKRPAYVQRAKVRVLDRPPTAVIDAVVQEIEEIATSRASEGIPLVRLKILVYSPKGNDVLGEHVFVVGELSAADEERGGSSASEGREGELVATVKELRLGLGDCIREMRAVSSGGLALALETVRELGAARQELADARGALIVAEGDKYEPMKELIEMLKPTLPVLVPMIVQKFTVPPAK